LRPLRANADRRARMGYPAHGMLYDRFTRQYALRRWRSLIEELLQDSEFGEGETRDHY
jgi:hypothetical protein